jgi:hypothetical protein
MPDAKYRSTFETLRREIMLGKFDASRKFSSEGQFCRKWQNLLVCFTQSTLSSQSNFKSEPSRTSRTWREICVGVCNYL